MTTWCSLRSGLSVALSTITIIRILRRVELAAMCATHAAGVNVDAHEAYGTPHYQQPAKEHDVQHSIEAVTSRYNQGESTRFVFWDLLDQAFWAVTPRGHVALSAERR